MTVALGNEDEAGTETQVSGHRSAYSIGVLCVPCGASGTYFGIIGKRWNTRTGGWVSWVTCWNCDREIIVSELVRRGARSGF